MARCEVPRDGLVLRIRLVASDVDGTITERRGSLRLSIEAVRSIRMLERNGITVSLVSGNSLPVVAGLSRYVGASGPSFGENGCIALWRGSVIHYCEGRPSEELVREILALGFKESWQNAFRFHDLAFLAQNRHMAERVLPRVRELASKEGMRVLWSGYAIHVQPEGGGKGRAVREAARLLGISLGEVLAVGDGQNDIDMFLPGSLKACPGDADPEVKKRVDIIATRPGGEGFAEIARIVLAGTGQKP